MSPHRASTDSADASSDTAAPVVIVTGPTAAGKTALALAIAEKFGGEIINADSMQVYRYMDIGTAKPSLDERARVPHHLFDIVTPDADYNAGRYASDARAVAAEIRARGHVPILTGGTGLYIRAFVEGLVRAGAAEPALRASLEAQHAEAVAAGDPERLHRRLAVVDPEAANRIHPNDLRRTIRALEIIDASGQPASALRAEHGFADRPFRSLHLAIDPGRAPLAARIDLRCSQMIEAGLLREVRGLRNMGYGPELRPMQAIGYRHINPVVDGLDTLVSALAAMQADTRRFARRQRTWLRKVEGVVWLHPDAEDEIMGRVERFLAEQTGNA